MASFVIAPAWASSDVLKCIEKQLAWHTLHQTPRKNTFPIKDLVNREKVTPTVASVVRSEGKPVEQVLKKYEVPQYAWKYFDHEGRFKYRPEKSIQLSVENGDEELLAARIQFVHFPDAKYQRVNDMLVTDYLRVLEKMPRARLIVTLNQEDQGALLYLLHKAPESVVKRVSKMVIDSSAVPNLWAQDGTKPIRVTSGAVLQTLAPIHQRALQQKAVWNDLGKQGWPIRRSIFEFEGGNVVVGERHVFVGPDVVERNMSKLMISRAEALDGLSAEFGKPVVEIKQNVIPRISRPSMHDSIDFHIDMFFAVARNHKTGKETVLLSSPELGFKALAGKRKNADFSQDWDTMCDQLVRGAKDNPTAPLSESEHALVETLKKTGARSFRAQQDQVNAEAVRLKAMGYDVKFIPGIAQEDGERLNSQWEVFSYANSIFSGKKTIIPQLGIPRLDSAATRVFENDLGYEVLHVHSPTESLCMKGGIRCMTETYRR